MSGFFDDEFAEGAFLRGEGYSTSIDPVDSAARFFDGAAATFDFLGLRDAAENLRRYRSGSGAPRHFSVDEIAAHEPYLEAEDVNRTAFESRTLVGRSSEEELNRRLQTLEDGELIEGDAVAVRAIRNSSPATFLAFGQSNVRSDLDFIARREW
jgi:hypothetical protein